MVSECTLVNLAIFLGVIIFGIAFAVGMLNAMVESALAKEFCPSNFYNGRYFCEGKEFICSGVKDKCWWVE